MHIGYSLTESEIVPAAELDYGDCAKFQIVCPACREAVFKGQRQRGDVVTHYLSHYRATAEEALMCEMRVASMASALGIKEEGISHAQTLQEFLNAFRSSIASAAERAGIIRASDLRKAASHVMVSPIFDECVSYLESERTKWPSGTRDGTAQLLAAMPAMKGRSSFWLRRQASYILDMETHLRTAQGRPNERWLWACGVVLAARSDAFEANRADAAKRAVVELCRAIAAGKPISVTRALFRRLGETSGPRAQEAVARQDAVYAGMSEEERMARLAWNARMFTIPGGAVRIDTAPKSGLDIKDQIAVGYEVVKSLLTGLDAETEAKGGDLDIRRHQLAALRVMASALTNANGLQACVSLRSSPLDSLRGGPTTVSAAAPPPPHRDPADSVLSARPSSLS